jgi:membrane protease YdiL (CAAX protease family)
MEARPTEPNSDVSTVHRSNYWDLAIYLICGFGLFTAAGAVVGKIYGANAKGLSFNTIIFICNLIFLGGTALVMGAGRGRFTLEQIGLWPVRWRKGWFLLALGLVVLLLPIRGMLGLLVEYLINGNLESLALRSQIVQPQGAGWLSFVVTLVFVGILVPFSEELFFRGAIYTWLRERTPMWPAALISAALFGLGHFDSLGVVAASFVMGIVNAIVFEKTRSIWVPFAIHAANNSLAVVLVYLATLLVKMLPGLAG